MKFIFKTFISTILALFVSFFVMYLIIIAIFFTGVSKYEETKKIKPNSLLVIDFNSAIVDRNFRNPLNLIDFKKMQITSNVNLIDIIHSIKKAASDSNIKGIYLDNNQSINSGLANIDELRNALLEFKKSKKFIVSFANNYSQVNYYLSSVADHLFLHPQGLIEWVGLRSEIAYLKNTMDKFGISPQIIRHGKYKSAVEPFMNDKMSDENKEQLSSLISAIWNTWVEGISVMRKIKIDELQEFAQKLVIRNAKKALEKKLVDKLMYKDEVIDYLKNICAIKKDKDLRSIDIMDYAKKTKEKNKSKNKIGLLYLSGTIIDGSDHEDGKDISGDHIGKVIRKIRRNKKIKALVVRVNSPGGSSLASEVIWRELELTRKIMPVVISFGDLAASGGYYLSVASDYIVSNPNTITGSIGVFGMFFSFKKILNNTFGVNIESVKTHISSDLGTPFRALTEFEKSVIQESVDDVYSTFSQHVADGRKMTVARVEELAQGRIWTGKQAYDNKLVDEIGGLDRAIEIAATRAKLKDYKIKELPDLDHPFQVFIKDIANNSKLFLFANNAMDWNQFSRYLKNKIKNSSGILTRLPFDINIE